MEDDGEEGEHDNSHLKFDHVKESSLAFSKTRVGEQAKDILNCCRLHFLRSRGWKAWIVPYTTYAVSPENKLLLALPPAKSGE
mmetsp:Transcript_41226/g.106624  ORF Transcript_41226/g.106624 Transcript_41226/m.106624 type:complete len:83 (-) Transcript_41226:136-384(-)